MDTLSIKFKQNYDKQHLGYIKPIVIKNDDSQWIAASKENVTTNGLVFALNDYNKNVEQVFQKGEIFQVEIEKLIGNTVYGECDYRVAAQAEYKLPNKSLEFHTVFRYKGIIEPNKLYQTFSSIKPTRFTFFIGKDETNEVVFGPFEVANTLYNSEIESWETQYKIIQPIHSSNFLLNPHQIYKVPIEAVTNNTIIEIPNESLGNNDGLYLSFNLTHELELVEGEKIEFIDDSSLLKQLSDILPNNFQFGRKQRNAIISEIKTSNRLSKINEERIANIINKTPDLREKYAGLIDKDLITKDKKTEDEVTEENRKLKKELNDVNSLNDIIEGDKKKLTEKLKKLENSLSKDNINTENIEIDKKQNLVIKQENKKEKAKLEKNKKLNKILNKTNAELENSKNELEAQYLQSMENFKTKVYENIPILNVLTNYSHKKNVNTNVNKPLNYDDCFQGEGETYLEELVKRIKQQNYHVENESFLYAVSAVFLSSRFTGFYGSPGTGKTALGKLLCNSITSQENNNNSRMISVEKGWSSCEDFIGSQNPFNNEFEYKDMFFSQFNNTFNNSSYEEFKILMFDEASLSSPDTYLSKFQSTSKHNLDHRINKWNEKINVSGNDFCFNAMLKFIMTFNHDASTVELSPKFVDRVPIIFCKDQNDAELHMIKEEQFPPFIPETLHGYLQYLNDLEFSSDIFENIYNDIDHWEKTLPNFKVSTRKKENIFSFMRMLKMPKNKKKEEFGYFSYISEEFTRDFITTTYFIPQISGHGETYKKGIEALINTTAQAQTKKILEKILEDGEMYKQYSYL